MKALVMAKVPGPARLGGRRYPWDEWFGRGRFRLVRGRDFNGRTDTMIQQLRNRARRDGKSLSVDVSGNGAVLTVAVRPATDPFPRGRRPGGRNHAAR